MKQRVEELVKRPEILAPAGDMEKLRTAVLYGADAVYLGGKEHNLRAAAQGFSGDELVKAVEHAHAHGSRVYYCINSLFREGEIATLPASIEAAAEAGVDAFIVADAGAFQLKQTYAPQTPAHMSTQLNTCNSEAIKFWRDIGATRVNLARELSSREIHAIGQAVPDMELEVFTHGAMCLALSGQCLLSAWLNDRPANSGRCTQPCRFQYRPHQPAQEAVPTSMEPEATLVEKSEERVEKVIKQGGYSLQGLEYGETKGGGLAASLVVEESLRPGEPLWEVQACGPEGQAGFSSMWAMEDLCLMPYVRWLSEHGVASLKIEGRMKGAAYVAHAVDAYKSAVTCLAEGRPFNYHEYMAELLHTASRPLGSGFFLPHKRRNYTEEMGTVPAAWQQELQTEQHLLAALVQDVQQREKGTFSLAMRGQWKKGYDLEIMLPGFKRPVVKAGEFSIENREGQALDVANSGQQVVLQLGDNSENVAKALQPGVFIRVIRKD